MSHNPNDEFEFLERVGQGQFGEVWKARHKKSNKILAIKKLMPGAVLADITKEIATMRKCVSPCVVRCYGNYFHDNMLCIIMEYCNLGSVNDVMAITGKTLTEPQIATVVKAMLQALLYMQTQNKIHRDIKPHNVLLNREGQAKLCDFGIASDLEAGDTRRTVVGTPYYLAPEVLKDQGYDYKADIWSVGITTLEMAEKNPYAELHPMRVLMVLSNSPAPGLTKDSWSREFHSFVNACLELNPKNRPNAQELLKHPFLAKADVSTLMPLIQEAAEVVDFFGGVEKARIARKPPSAPESEANSSADNFDFTMDSLTTPRPRVGISAIGTSTGITDSLSGASTSRTSFDGGDDDDDDDDEDDSDEENCGSGSSFLHDLLGSRPHSSSSSGSPNFRISTKEDIDISSFVGPRLTTREIPITPKRGTSSDACLFASASAPSVGTITMPKKPSFSHLASFCKSLPDLPSYTATIKAQAETSLSSEQRHGSCAPMSADVPIKYATIEISGKSTS